MGSLVTFGEIVTQKTGIITRVMARTDTVMVIDAVRRAILPGMDIDQLVSVLEENPKYITRLANKDYGEHAKRPRAILAACITGEGSALKVKELIENLLPGLNEQAEIIPIGAMAGDTKEIIASIRKSKDVIAVVGTINPNVPGLPFIFIESILDGSGIQQLRQLLEYNITAEYAGSAEAGEDRPGPGGEPAAKEPAAGEARREREDDRGEPQKLPKRGSVDLGNVFSKDLTIFESEAATKEEVMKSSAADGLAGSGNRRF
jgi:galactitol-specific phosphotransferase system IIB component